MSCVVKFVCPKPIYWSEIFQVLKKAWERDGQIGLGPPVPLILNGWAFTNDVQKNQRWEETVEWAQTNGYSKLIPELSNGQKYQVNEMTSYLGPYGDTMYPWDFEPKQIPSKEEVEKALGTLRDNWEKVVGANLAKISTPIRFTGRKRRRLVVLVDANTQPPWGTWQERLYAQKFAFTEFRKAINDAILPHMVDHIDFEISDP